MQGFDRLAWVRMTLVKLGVGQIEVVEGLKKKIRQTVRRYKRAM